MLKMKKNWRNVWKSHSPYLKIYLQMQAGKWNFTPWLLIVNQSDYLIEIVDIN